MYKVWIASATVALALTGCAVPDAEPSDAVVLPADALGAAPIGLSLEGPVAATIGGTATFTVTGAIPGERVRLWVGSSLEADGTCLAALGGQCVDLDLDGGSLRATADANGVAVFTPNVNPRTPADNTKLFVATAFRGPGGADSVASNIVRARASDGGARIRVVHGSPDAPPVDIYADGGLLIPGLAYQASSGYASVPAGTYTIDIRAAGAPSTSPPAFTIPALTLDANVDYTAIAAGFLGSTDPADQFRVIALGDAWGSPAVGSYRARIVHASPDAPTVDIDVGADGSSEIPALARFADTGIEGVQLPSDTVLQVGVAGNALPFTIPGLPEGSNVLVIANGTLGAARPNTEDAFGLLAIIDDGQPVFIRQNPIVYAFHGSPDAPTVDIKAGDATIIDDLSFRDLSNPVQVPPGTYDLGIFDETGSVNVFNFSTPALMAGERYLAIATGFFGGGAPGFTVLALGDDLAIDENSASVTAIHASPDAPTVTVGLGGGTYIPLDGPFSFGDVGTNLVVPGGVYDLAIGNDVGDTALIDFAGTPLPAGARYFAIANGELLQGDFAITVIDTTATPWAAIDLFPTP